MKFRQVSLIVLGALSLGVLSSCNPRSTVDPDRVGAKFYLEGGHCQNTSREYVQYYYSMPEGVDETFIADPNVLKEGDISRVGYHIEGWYRNKEVVSEDVYSPYSEGKEVVIGDGTDVPSDDDPVETASLLQKSIKKANPTENSSLAQPTGFELEVNDDDTYTFIWDESSTSSADRVNAVFVSEAEVEVYSVENLKNGVAISIPEGNIDVGTYTVHLQSVNDGVTNYTDKWSFETDKMTREGVSLYANWDSDVVYSFELYYKNDLERDVLLGTYEVEAGQTFRDFANYASLRSGYTPVDYTDEEGNIITSGLGFTHPGGDESLAVKIYVTYIQGTYSVVKTPNELILALSSSSNNIYLARDIDMNGATLTASNYSAIFDGANHTISNFVVGWDTRTNGVASIALFNEIENATFKDVTFADVALDVFSFNSRTTGIRIGTLANSIKNSTLDNVHFAGAYTINRGTTITDIEWNLTELAYSVETATTTITNSEVVCTITDNRPIGGE